MECVCGKTQSCNHYPDCLEVVSCLYRSPEEIEAEYQYYKELEEEKEFLASHPPNDPDNFPDAPDW